MKRIKAIFSAIRTLGRSPDQDISAAWGRICGDLGDTPNANRTTEADLHLIQQCMFGVMDEAVAWKKKQGEEVEGAPAGQ